MASQYKFYPADSPQEIAEQQYASAENKIQFTLFTSCLGVVAKKGQTLSGVHVVIVGRSDVKGQEGPRFGAQDVPKVIELLQLPADAVAVFGDWSIWRDPRNKGIKPAFEKLTGELGAKVGKDIKMYQQYDKDIGIYVAEVAGDGILVRDLNTILQVTSG